MVWACLLAGAVGTAPDAADAATYSARARWRPSGESGVIGYRVYTRPAGGAFTLAVDAGMPAPGADGSIAVVVRGLDVCTAHGVVVTSYRGDGVESPFSNEIALSYAGVAPSLDTDGDGLANASEDRDLDCLVDAGETDPLRADTDGDGVGDARDTCQGTAAGAPVNGSGCSCAQIACDDGNACNGRETCAAGVCQRGAAPDCNDGNACTADACGAATGCTHTPIAGCRPCTSAAQCDDANACNGLETCVGGVCRSGTAPDCNDGNACTADACGAATGCTHTPIASCTACATNAQCDDGNPCTVELCSGGRCARSPLADGASCDDGNACNGRERCLATVCQRGTVPDCNDGDACTVDACSVTAGCTHTAMAGCSPCATAADCDDRNACTAEVCLAGRCARAPLVDGTACGDTLFCNGAETCRSGVCAAGPPVSCDDGSTCTADACDETTRRCTHAPVAGCCTSDAECAVSDACHTNARCETGRCLTDPVVCADPGPCAAASCDPEAGCRTTPLPDGTPCDDGDACTTTDACAAGACVASEAPRLSVDDEGGASITRLTTRTTVRGLVVGARASFPAPDGMLAPDGDLDVALRDGSGVVLFETSVPAARFARAGEHRAVYRDDRRADGGGLTLIELRTRGGRGSLSLRAIVPPAAGVVALEALQSAAQTTATLDWKMQSANRCVNGSGQCKGRTRRCR